MTKETLHRVFVYGTLKRGHGNHRLLETSKLVTEAVTTETYSLLDVGFPVLVPPVAGKCGWVAGEVYEVDTATLARLDRLESEGSMYHRRAIALVTKAGKPVKGAQAYFGGVHFSDSVSWCGLTPVDGVFDWRPRSAYTRENLRRVVGVVDDDPPPRQRLRSGPQTSWKGGQPSRPEDARPRRGLAATYNPWGKK